MKKAVLAVFAVPALVLPMMLGGGSGQAASGTAVGISGVPSEYVADVLKAGAICEEVTPSVIAAQLAAESGFDPNAGSSAGAQGIAQFMPSTWASAGMDGDGDGHADILNPHDAIWTQGNYMCGQVALVKQYLAAGRISGGVLELTLAAYNAGMGAVLGAGGIPPYRETQQYVSSIIAAMASYVVQYSGGGAGAAQSADALVAGPAYDASGFGPELASLPDPTPGNQARGGITPRLNFVVSQVMATYPQIVNPALYCWDAHTFNPTSDHSRGRACDIPFYGCTFGDPGRAADPTTGALAGNAAANWLVANASQWGIKYVIWNGQIWFATTGTWQTYTGAPGSDPTTCAGGHYDHIHVSVY
ncbi:lytic transglycosylase domain-containing protein [Actinomyces urogenitalis]|uniref:lytic transglycosylase domain-containing protein n=1 Tax=Actinomyces urogenitalis TaxID=103621 RepID=UPI00242E948D|nr:lytic transglycosylase domain-containing protein [Actinomyces urogenitalis]MCI7456328.1 lytic transglycosylase domain-containing protein [Actinomyces urogenitalis]